MEVHNFCVHSAAQSPEIFTRVDTELAHTLGHVPEGEETRGGKTTFERGTLRVHRCRPKVNLLVSAPHGSHVKLRLRIPVPLATPRRHARPREILFFYVT